MKTLTKDERLEKLQTRIVIWVGVLILVYIARVLGTAWGYSQYRPAGALPYFGEPTSDAYCLKAYYANLVPGSDLNAFFFDDYDEVSLHAGLLSDPACLGKLISHGTSYIQRNSHRRQLVIRLFDPSTMEVKARIVLRP